MNRVFEIRDALINGTRLLASFEEEVDMLLDYFKVASDNEHLVFRLDAIQKLKPQLDELRQELELLEALEAQSG